MKAQFGGLYSIIYNNEKMLGDLEKDTMNKYFVYHNHLRLEGAKKGWQQLIDENNQKDSEDLEACYIIADDERGNHATNLKTKLKPIEAILARFAFQPESTQYRAAYQLKKDAVEAFILQSRKALMLIDFESNTDVGNPKVNKIELMG